MTTEQPTSTPSTSAHLGVGGVLLRVLFGVGLLIFLGIMLAYVAAGTRGGTLFVLDVVSKQTGVGLHYQDGTLKDGIRLAKVSVSPDEKTHILASDVELRVGWRALWLGQIHLDNAKIGHLDIFYNSPPTGEPFDYMTVATPIALHLSDTHIGKLTIAQAGTTPVVLADIHAKSATWQNADIELVDGKLAIEIDKETAVQIDHANGQIALTGDYPVKAMATVMVEGLDEYFIAPFKVKADGSLRYTVGEVEGAYNGSPVTGKVAVQSLETDLPFWADLSLVSGRLPYADDENIEFGNVSVAVSGNLETMALRFNTELVGKHIPQGNYHGRAILTPAKGMTVDFLQVNAKGGSLIAKGQLDWQHDFKMNATLKSADKPFAVHTAIPSDYQEYQAYIPTHLTGELGLALGLKDKDDHSWYHLELNQETQKLSANIRQKNSKKSLNPNPVILDLAWTNLYYKNLPDIGELSSPAGTATVTLGDTIDIRTNANLAKLSVLPAGDYVADLIIKNRDVAIKSARYLGEAGDLVADGVIYLPTNTRPLSWTINGNSNQIKPNAYFELMNDPTRVPVLVVVGRFASTGRFRRGKNGDEVEISLTDSDLTAQLAKQQLVAFKGDANAKLSLKNNELTYFDSDFDGQLSSKNIHALLDNNKLNAKLSGTPTLINISKFVVHSKAGVVSGAGSLELADGLAWKMNVRTDNFNTALLHKEAHAIITGDVATTGKYKNGQLIAVKANVDSVVLSNMAKLPSGKLTANLSGQNNRYTIDNLVFDDKNSRLTGMGKVDLNKGVSGELTLVAHNFNTAPFIKTLNSQLTGSTSFAFGYKDSEQFIDIKALDIQGKINGERMLATGKLLARVDLPSNFGQFYANLKKGAKASFNLDAITGGFKDSLGAGLTQLGQHANKLQADFAKQDRAFRKLIKTLNAEHLTLVYGDNRVDIHGNEQKMAVNVNATALAQFVKTMRGQVVGGFILQGDENSLPTIFADLKISNISMPSFALREGSLVGKIVNLANQDSSLVLQGNNLVVMGKTIRKVRADLFGVQSNHDIRLAMLSNEMQMGVRLQGGLLGDNYTGVLSEGRLQTQMGVLNQLQPTELAYNIKSGQLRAASHCWQTISAHSNADSRNTGALCFAKPLAISSDKGELALAVQNLDTAVFMPMLPSDLSWRARLNGKVNASWGNKTPNIDMVLYSDNGVVGMRNDGLSDTTLPYERVSFIAKSTPAGLKVRADVRHRDNGGFVDVLIDPYKTNKPIVGQVTLERFNLAVLRPFFPAMQTLAGTVGLSGQVSGTLKKPLIFGNATLTDGAIVFSDVPMPLSNINANLAIKGTQASLTGKFSAGNGNGILTGELDWQKNMVAKLGVSGDDLAVVSPPLITAQVSPDVEVLIKPSDKLVDIKGVISVPKAAIRPPEASKTVVEQSADVTVIDRRQSGNLEAILATAAPWEINADVGVDLGGDVVFQGFGAKLPLAGAISLTQSGQGRMQGRGLVQVSERTKVDAIGQNLELNYAQIRFDGNLTNPRLSIEGVRQIDGQTVGVRVTDRLASPNIVVFNDAGLSEQQAMNALVTGSLSETGTQISEQNLRNQVTNTLAAAGLSFGLQGTRTLTNELGRALGLEGLTLDASGNAYDTNVNVTGYITPDLYIRYGVGVFNAQSSLSARYQLTRRVYVEATAATEGIVDVVYRWRFGNKPKQGDKQ